MRIVVADPIGNHGQGGAVWALRQYVLGLRRLGHDVCVVERDEPVPGFDAVFNTSGMLAPESIALVPVRVYLDLDPAFNQLWHEDGIDRRFEGHTHFVTVGQAIGTASCDVPTDGRRWIGTLPPVVLEEWPVAVEIETDALTTVANLRAYGSVERENAHYGQKVHSLRRLIELPRLTQERFVLAMDVHPDERSDLAALAENGWELVDPAQVAGTPDAYRHFVQGSRAEIGIAKSGYVHSRCAWFSDRSACYLASGRPVVAQDTGFSRFVPTGEGLLAFDDENGATAAVAELRRDYARHAAAARELAVEHFDSDLVLSRVLEQVCA